MTKILQHITSLLIAFLASLALCSCEDRIDYPGAPIEEGISTVEAEIGFKAFTPTLESRSSGTAMKYINSLWVVIYDRSGKFIKKEEILDFKSTVDDANNRPDGQPSSESSTGCAKFKLTLENGYYKIYAVVNHDISGLLEDQIDTIDKLKKLDLEWKSGDVVQNAQMFGWFINGGKDDDHGNDAPVVTVSSKLRPLHAWVRRAASKVTIAFNTNNLNEDVNIYLKSVTIKDIPSHCFLDADNSPGNDGYTLDSKLLDGETIYFKGAEEGHTGKADHAKWPCLHSGDRVYGLFSDVNGRDNSTSDIGALVNREHSETAPALYFFENLQGIGTLGTETDKRQDVTGENKQVWFPEGVNPGNPGWKDGKLFGSYIEVKGYYENNGAASPGRGDIAYRFMLGKDHLTDYEAERNYHYKLTMSFNGNANDIDFHIDYEEEARPGFHVQDTTYVSYLYNQTSHTILRATPSDGYDLVSLQAYILDNEWRPYFPTATKDVDYNEKAWNSQVAFTNSYVSNAGSYQRPDYVAKWTEYDGKAHSDRSANNTEFGFLSLRKVTRQILELGGSGDKYKFVAKMRKRYFLGDENADNGVTTMDKSLGYRNYGDMPSSEGTHVIGNETDGQFDISVKRNPRTGQVDYVMEVPLYTRAKSIDSYAVYSGANPFYKHARRARVRFIAKYKKIDKTKPGPDTYEESGETIVLQSRRIINPRAIYRRHGNKDPFLVTLCYNKLTAEEQLKTQKANNVVDTVTQVYEPIISDGPWSAVIDCDPHGLVSISANGRTATRVGQSITGRNNTPVQFRYKPMVDGPEDGSYGAIVTVYYHGNNCSHKIILKQGYGATEVAENSTIKWSAYCVYDKDNLTVNPLSVGSTFRRYSDMKQPIAESNNLKYKVHEVPDGPLDIVGLKTALQWSSINANSNCTETTFSTMKFKNVETQTTNDYRLPDYLELPYIGIYSDKEDLKQQEKELKYVENIGTGFGITYADGATVTQITQKATSFYDPLNNIMDSQMGCRGAVVYSTTTGNNVFFPFGRWGHPRRRRNGELQYGSVDFLLSSDTNIYRPMAYGLMYQVGAAFWTTAADATHKTAIDFNGGSYMSSYLNHDDVFQSGGKADALPVKPIRK
ncbi:MAG: hypothetical protein NC082_03515 [Clostridiales bacterium]|nr:hypothetical protein [Clostridiales bacterium]